MDGLRFFEKVREHPDLEWRGVVGDRIHIANRKTDKSLSVDVASILQHEEKQLFGVLLGEREPFTMSHWTRIVGYFSSVKDWNKSKLAELRDRRRGNYAVRKDVA